MYKRNIFNKLESALADTPVILLNGPRQSGKSTLAQWLIKEEYFKAKYLTLDSLTALTAAKNDPLGFLISNEQPLVIDEIQRVPELLLAIKEIVDKKRKAGRFLLTGSANVFLIPQVSESLAGRMEVIKLLPLSQGELSGIKEQFIDWIFSADFHLRSFESEARQQIFERVYRGGYPEVIGRKTSERKIAWYESYITAILHRDIRELSHIEGITQLPNLLSLLATRLGTLANFAEISRSCGIAHTSLMRYMALLQTTYLVYLMPPWSKNKGKRLIKSPKLYLYDTGLACYLKGVELSTLSNDPQLGLLLENFIVMEITKQLTWSKINAKAFHYRTQTGQEVDIILETNDGRCVGIEIKASSTISEKDLNGLKQFASEHEKNFLRGIILYTGTESLSLGKNLYAIPLNSLWHDFG